MPGAIDVSTGRWVYRLGRRCAADFIALLDQLLAAFPQAPAIAVICDNDSIHHARKITAYLDKHPRLEPLYGARYSPHDNPAERIWAALKNYVANTAVSWPGRLRQIHSFFRTRSPDQMLATAAPWTSPWLPPGYEQNYWNAALVMGMSRRLFSACRSLAAEQEELLRAIQLDLPELPVTAHQGPIEEEEVEDLLRERRVAFAEREAESTDRLRGITRQAYEAGRESSWQQLLDVEPPLAAESPANLLESATPDTYLGIDTRTAAAVV